MEKVSLTNSNNISATDIDAITHCHGKQYAHFEIKNLKQNSEAGTFTAHAAVFNNIDGQNDVIVPGAFDKTLLEGRKIILLSQHDTTKVLGVITNAFEDQKGLFIEGKFTLEVQDAKEMRALLRDGAINSLSIGFSVKDSSFDQDTGVRFLKEIELFEVSFVTFPANEQATLESVKNNTEITQEKTVASLDNLKTLKDIETFLRKQGGFSKNKATAIVSITKKLLSESEASTTTNQNLSESGQAKNNQSESETKQLQSIIDIINNNTYVSNLQDINKLLN